MKKALIIRLGAYGDLIMATPLIRKVKESGYHVTVNAKPKQAHAVLKANPYVDNIILYEKDLNIEELKEYWKELGNGFDVVYNLSGSIEEYLLKKQGTPEFEWSFEKRHGFCNVNYYDHTLNACGFEDKGTNGELFFTFNENRFARNVIKKHKDQFTILWSLSGSSFHKVYPYTEYVMQELLARYEDVVIFAVGDEFCEIFTPGLRHPRIKNYIDKWSMRTSMLMSKYVDCVVGTDTGLLVAAGCFDTPKVILLSHTSRENLTKYWNNTIEVTAGVGCQPCHRLIYTVDACPHDKVLKSPICMSQLPAQKVYDAINYVYKEKKHGNAIYWSKELLSGREQGI